METLHVGKFCELHGKEVSMTCQTDGENICVSCVKNHHGHQIEIIKPPESISSSIYTPPESPIETIPRQGRLSNLSQLLTFWENPFPKTDPPAGAVTNIPKRKRTPLQLLCSPPLSRPSRRHATKSSPIENLENYSTESTILALGEDGEYQILEMGKSEDDKWTKWTEGIDVGCFFAVCCVFRKIFVAGGRRDGDFSSSVDIYNIDRQEWSEGPAISSPRFGMTGCFVESLRSFFIFGGFNNQGLSLTTVERLQLDSKGNPLGKWQQVTSMNVKRWACGAAPINDKVFLVGGQDKDTSLSAMEVFDVGTETWSDGPSMEVARCEPAVESCMGQLFVFGGSNEHNMSLKSCEKFDPETNLWTTISSMGIPRRGPGSVVIDDKVYIIGGWTEGASNRNSVSIYDTVTDTWKMGPPLTQEIGWPTRCVCW